MIKSIISLIVLVLPGYLLLRMEIFSFSRVDKKDRFIFGTIIWLFYIISSVTIIKIISPFNIKRIFLYNYFMGIIIILCYLFERTRNLYKKIIGSEHIISVFSNRKSFQSYKFHIRIQVKNLVSFGFILFLISIIAYISVITLYTPIIYQHDATSIYLIEAYDLFSDFDNISIAWPTFGDSMPLTPILYSWFYFLSNTPVLRLIPMFFFILNILLLYNLSNTFFKDDQIAYISIIAWVSMTLLHWYMSKTSLYQDLYYTFFISSSFYVLYLNLNDKNNIIYKIIMGFNLTLLIFSKEYGLFYAWYCICTIIFFIYKFILFKYININLKKIFIGFSIILPYIIFHFGSIYAFKYYSKDITHNITIVRLSLFIIFFILFLLNYYKIDIDLNKQNLKPILYFFMPLIIPLIFFSNNLYNINTIAGSFLEVYIQRLSVMKIIFPQFEPSGPFRHFINFKPYSLFMASSFLVTNLIPFAAFFKDILWKNPKKGIPSSYLNVWFLYALFIYYYFSYGYISGDSIRVLLPLSVPIALMIGKGAHNIITKISYPKFLNIIIYLYITSINLWYIYYIKLNPEKFWMINFNKLTNEYIVANYFEIIIFTLPWLLIMIIQKIKINMSFIKKNLFIIILIIPSIMPITLFVQSVEYIDVYDPKYYDTAYSIEAYEHHWLMPVIKFYDSQIQNEVGVTIGFGVTPLKHFLKRPFIDLSHPRNWIIYLPLLQNITVREVLDYLDQNNIRFFLIPTQIYFTRERYEATLNYSTLFNLIVNSESIHSDEGQLFMIKHVAELGAFNLYQIYYLSS